MREVINTDRLPPHSEEMERGVLGCILMAPQECLPQCLLKFKAGRGVFYDLRHQTIYSAMLETHEAGHTIDVLTIHQWLKNNQKLEQIGGVTYLASLQDAATSAANLTYYADVVHEKYVLRRLIQTCSDIVGRIYDFQGEVRDLLDQSERELFKIGEESFRTGCEIVPMKELVQRAIDRIEQAFARQGAISGLPTGFVDLDRETDGLQPGDFIVVSAFTSVGKTAFAMNVAENIILNNKVPVGVFSLEMTAEQLAQRCLCSNARVNMRAIRNGFMAESDFPKITSAAARLSHAPLYLDDSSDLSIGEVRARARRMVQQYGVKFIVVDYLQLLRGKTTRRSDTREQEVADISDGLKQMAKELRIPVMALSQLNDDGKLRESRRIGMDADGNWNLEEVEGGTPEASPMILRLRKNRNGVRDVVINLTFLKEYTRFENSSRTAQEDVPRAR